MPKCLKCDQFFPPGFVLDEDPISGDKLVCSQCLFCLKDSKVISYGIDSKQVTKKEIIREYKEFVHKLKENPNIMRESAKGKEIIKGAEKFMI